MSWENWLIGISIFVIALAFVALVIFLIVTLVSLRHIVTDLDQKVRAFDPIFRVVNRAGEAIEQKTAHMERTVADVDEAVSERYESKKEGGISTAMEVAEWALIGLTLWQRIQKRKRR